MYRDKHVSPRPGIVEKVKRERRKPRSPLGSIRRSLCTKEGTRDFVLNSNVTGVVNAWDHQRFSNKKKKKEQKKGPRRGQSAVDLAMCDKHSDTEVELDLHTYVFTVNLFHINYSYVYFSSNFPSTLTYSRVVHVAAWFLRKYRVWEKKKEDNRSLCGLCESEPTQRRYSKNLVRIARLQNRCDRWTSVSSVLT